MLSVLAAVVLSGSPSTELHQPAERWLSAKAGLEQLTPGDWAELVATPDSVTLEGLRDATERNETPFGPSQTKFTVAWKKTLERPADVSRVLKLFRTGSLWKLQNQEACAPDRCVVVVKCGGFRPVLAITLTKQDRAMRVLVCFSCGEAWAQRFVSKTMLEKDEAGREQALLGDKKAWLAVFAPLVPEGDVIQILATPVSTTRPRRCGPPPWWARSRNFPPSAHRRRPRRRPRVGRAPGAPAFLDAAREWGTSTCSPALPTAPRLPARAP